MKKTIAALAALVSAAVFAGQNDLLITFSTPGPDKYADDSVVLDGESYALVWTSNAGGDPLTVLLAPFAKDGKCQPTLFSIDESNVSKYDDGTWSVCLLDTRDFAGDPSGKTLTPRKDVDVDSGKGVNAKATIVDGIVTTGTFNSAPAVPAVAAGDFDLESAGVPSPKVTGIQVLDDNVAVTVSDTVPFVGYTLQSGDDAFNFTVPEGASSANGKTGADITLVTPKKDGAQFFKVSTLK